MTIYQNQKQAEQQQGQQKELSGIQGSTGHMQTRGIDDEPCSAGSEEGSFNPEAEQEFAPIRNSCRRAKCICKSCGKEFLSRKSFLERECCSCINVDDEPDGMSPTPSPPSSYKGKEIICDGDHGSRACSPSTLLTDDEHVANCLMMLSHNHRECNFSIANAGECSTATDMKANEITPLPIVSTPTPTPNPPPRKMFVCNDCKKVFASHQALGGHRASHKKVKGCFAARLEIESRVAKKEKIEDEKSNVEHRNNHVGSSSENMGLSVISLGENSVHTISPKKKETWHECSVCKRRFPSGQALGGHKRCHWIALNTGAAKLRRDHNIEENAIQLHTLTLRQMFNTYDHCTIDLNLPPPPPPMDDFGGISQRLDVPDVICIELKKNVDRKRKRSNAIITNINNMKTEEGSNVIMEDEAESKEMKRNRFIDLMDFREGEDISSWLQIGIGFMPPRE